MIGKVIIKNILISLTKVFSWKEKGSLSKIITILLLTVIFISTAFLMYSIIQPKRETFTEFYMLGQGGKASNYPTELKVGEKATVILGIANHEYRNVTYYVEIWLIKPTHESETNVTEIQNLTLMDDFSITLPNLPADIESEWRPQYEVNYTFSINKSGKWQVWFLLFKDQRPLLPDSKEGWDKEAKKRIIEAIRGEILSLKLNINVSI